MPRLFNGSSAYLLWAGDAPCDGVPLSLSIWFQLSSIPSVGVIWQQKGGTDQRLNINIGDAVHTPGNALVWTNCKNVAPQGGSIGPDTGMNAVSDTTAWHHILLVMRSGTNVDHELILDGDVASKAVATATAEDITGHDHSWFGGFNNGSANTPTANWFPGRVAFAAFWNIALDPDRYAQLLYAGADPRSIGPMPARFLEMDGRRDPEIDEGTLHDSEFTNNGTSVVGGGPPVEVWRPRKQIWFPPAPVIVIPTPAAVVGTTIGPGVVLGSLDLAPNPAAAVAASVDPSVAEGDVTVSPAPAEAVGDTVDPGVILGSLTLVPAPADAGGSTQGPAVVLGSLTLSPAPAAAIGSTSGPTVLSGGILVTPAPATAVGSKVDPTVIRGSITITPGAAAAIAEATGPVVLLGSTSVSPAPAAVVVETVGPTIVITGLELLYPPVLIQAEYTPDIEITISELEVEIAGDYTPEITILGDVMASLNQKIRGTALFEGHTGAVVLAVTEGGQPMTDLPSRIQSAKIRLAAATAPLTQVIVKEMVTPNISFKTDGTDGRLRFSLSDAEVDQLVVAAVAPNEIQGLVHFVASVDLGNDYVGVADGTFTVKDVME